MGPWQNLEVTFIELTDGLDVSCEGEEGAMHPLKCVFSTRKMVSIS